MSNESKNTSSRNREKIPPELQRLIDGQTEVSGVLYGIDPDLYKDNAELNDKIKINLSQIQEKYKETTGDNILELFDSIAMNNAANKKKRVSSIQDFNDYLKNPDNYNIGELFSNENDRFALYNNYRLITLNIPQMAQALETYVNNILSPDDYTKTTFNIFIDGKPYSEDGDTSFNDINANIKKLNDIYNIDVLARDIIRDSLEVGDEFVLISPIADELEKVLSEDVSPEDIFTTYHAKKMAKSVSTNEQQPLDEGIHLESAMIDNLSNDEITLIEEMVLHKELNSITDKDRIECKSKIADIINKNVIFTEDVTQLYKNALVMKEDFKAKTQKGALNQFSMLDKTFMTNSKSTDKINSNSSSGDTINVNGSIVKILDPEKVVKLSYDNNVYGYFYIENMNPNDGYLNNNQFLMSKTNNMYTNFKSTPDSPEMVNNKFKLITDIFVKNISKKIDKKFINDHPTFKNVIYNLLKQNYIVEKQIRITYIPPDKMVHFGIGNGEYYDSIFKNILFTAKIYLATLISTLMTKLVRSPEKRVVYIETDIDNDTEAAVQAVVRDFKTKEIKMENLKDMNSVMNSIGTFNDIFIPRVNGDKPIEIDTLPGMNVDMNNDFTEYLLNTMISGIGIPSDFLNIANQTEFARSLAMQNAKFARDVLMKQKILGKQFTRFYRILYKNEYLNNNNNKREKIKENESIFNEQSIEIKFPPPSSLNMSTINEQIGNSRDYIDFVVQTLTSETDEQDFKDLFRREITKSVIPSVNWSYFENILEKDVRIKYEEFKIQKSKEGLNKPEGEDAESGDGGEEDSGDMDY